MGDEVINGEECPSVRVNKRARYSTEARWPLCLPPSEDSAAEKAALRSEPGLDEAIFPEEGRFDEKRGQGEQTETHMA